MSLPRANHKDRFQGVFPPMVGCIKKFSLVVTVAQILYLSGQENMVKHRYFVFIHVLAYL